MKVGTVTGQLVGTCKHPQFEGYRLLVVEPEKLGGLGGGPALIAIDRIGARTGERVLLVDDGSAALGLLGNSGPIRSMIVGVVDETVTEPD